MCCRNGSELIPCQQRTIIVPRRAAPTPQMTRASARFLLSLDLRSFIPSCLPLFLSSFYYTPIIFIFVISFIPAGARVVQTSRPALGRSQPPTQWVPGVKRPGRGADHPPSSSVEVKERVELYLYSPSGPSWPVLG